MLYALYCIVRKETDNSVHLFIVQMSSPTKDMNLVTIVRSTHSMMFD